MENFREAETYDRTSANQREDGMNLISLLPIQMGNRILDLGCGTGYLSKVLANKIGADGKVRIGKQIDTCLISVYQH